MGYVQTAAEVSYVKTAAEVSAAQDLLRNLKYESERVKVLFQTEPDFVRDVLPPCFAAAPDAGGMVTITRSRSDGADALDTRFLAASLFIRAMFRDAEGWYHLTMLLTGDMPITIGRELFGEAKKRADIHLDVSDNHASGYAERHGTRLIEVDLELGPDLGPRESIDNNLDLKCFLNSQATDLEYDPIVTVAPCRSQVRVFRVGTGTLNLRSSAEDPCGTVPVVAVDSISYEQLHSKYQHTDKYHLDDREGYLPYVIGRCYDFSNVR